MAQNVAPSTQQRKWTRLLTVGNVIAAVIVIAALLFILQNRQSGTFQFLVFDLTAPGWLWMLGVFAAGFLAGFLIARHRRQSTAKH